jgi:hypothetical protein
MTGSTREYMSTKVHRIKPVKEHKILRERTAQKNITTGLQAWVTIALPARELRCICVQECIERRGQKPNPKKYVWTLDSKATFTAFGLKK